MIAYGSVKVRCAAVQMLFMYWPQTSPLYQDRKSNNEKHPAWIPLSCQNENCASTLR